MVESEVSEACIYCAGRSGDLRRTEEHIWPQALGGDFGPPLFTTKHVCKRCNDVAGQWVDRAFLRNFFTSSERSKIAREFLDPNKTTAQPLVFTGLDVDFPVRDGEVCERWLGPAGESIYHIHEADDDRWLTLAGGDFFKRKRDPGRVYFALTGASYYWMATAIASVIRYFPRAKIRSLTDFIGDPIDLPVMKLREEPLLDFEQEEIEWIFDRPKGPHNQHMTINIGYADRFLAKLALGFGRSILGPAVSVSPYANELRKMLWSKDISDRGDIGVRGTGPWDNQAFAGIERFIRWPGAWSLFFHRAGDCFGLIVGTSQGRLMSIVLSDNPSLWRSEHLETHQGGALYLVIPQREHVFGPIRAMSLIGHVQGHRAHPDLLAVEALRTDPAKLPPYERLPVGDVEKS